MGMYYDIDGNPLELLDWARLFEDDEYKRIAATHVGDVWISTVWLGLNHSPWGHGPPVIFETMIFPEQEYQVRTSTKEAALAEHDQAVAYVESGEYARWVRALEGERSER